MALLLGLLGAGAGAYFVLPEFGHGLFSAAQPPNAPAHVARVRPAPAPTAPVHEDPRAVNAGTHVHAAVEEPHERAAPEWAGSVAPAPSLRLTAESALPHMMEAAPALPAPASARSVYAANTANTGNSMEAVEEAEVVKVAEVVEVEGVVVIEGVEEAEAISAVNSANDVTYRPLRVVRSEPSGALDAMLQHAWATFMRGDVIAAREGYLAVVARDDLNRDGLLGMAAVEAAMDNRPAALGYYRRLLMRDPRDVEALAGLAALDGDPRTGDEDALRALAREGGQSGNAQFVLGNRYAAQWRWADAQQAYFEASRRAPDNPDFAFNLAVSLEHLGQRQPALDHYRRALDLARQRAYAFDADQALARIEALRKTGGRADDR